MRPLLLAAAFLLAAAVPAAPQAARAPETSQANQECLGCHAAGKPGESDAAGRLGVFEPAFAESVHKDLDCTTCHAGYTPGGPHEPPPPSNLAEAMLAERLAAAKTLEGKPAVGAPRAYAACGSCHAETWEDLRDSPHGRWLDDATRRAAGATCASCHGSPHEVKPRPDPKEAAATRAYQVAFSSRCLSCHADPKFSAAMGLPADIAREWADSIHGRLVAVGSKRAPVCITCHAWMVREHGRPPRPGLGHRSIAGGKAPASAVFFSDPPRESDPRVQTCARCHPAATANFAKLQAHKPWQETHQIPHVVHIAFSWLTTLTLLFFAFHVSVDFVYELRKRLARRKQHEDPEGELMVQRFDIHQRIQHWMMLAGVIMLGLTGWPLRGAGAVVGGSVTAAQMAERIESSRAFLSIFGGPHGAGIVHRVAAVTIILSGAYHLFYLTFLAAQKRLPMSMLPGPKDAIDIRDNLLYMLGLSKKKPQFDRYNYLEKFDYWAVFWGIVMMVGSGFIFWFPAEFARFLPSWVITAVQIIHGEEATLAILFLFCVHFYNVHLKPSIFPMSWIWLNGKISLEAMREEHPLEYQRVKREDR